MSFDFKIPKEEKWVRQVKLGTEPDINQFLRKTADSPQQYRSFNILGTESTQGLILLVYEEHINVEENSEQ